MRKIIILFTLFPLLLSTYAQDVIIRNNGAKLECKITNVDSATVFFDLSKNGKEISTSMAKENIAEIIYDSQPEYALSDSVTMKKAFGGYQFYSKNKRLNIKQLVETLEPNELAYKEIKAAQTTYTFSMILGYTGGFLIGWPVGTALGGGEPNWTMAAVGAGIIVVAIPISNKFNKQAKSAIDIYNSGLTTSSFWDKNELNFTVSNNGVGFTLSF